MWPPENVIGLEVEMEGEGLMGLNTPAWRKDGDGSLRGHGVEFILDHPLSEKDAYEAVDALYQGFKRADKIKPSNRCGVHVHVNCQWLEIEQVFNYITLYLILEDLILKWCGEDREGNLFCLRAKDAEWLLYSLIGDKRDVGIFSETTNRRMYKYASINIAAIHYYGSLEFRALRTPSSPKPVKDFISLLLRIREKALDVREGKDFISACSARGETEWAREILGPHFNMLRCGDMDHMIMEGIRRIQALAYTPLKKLSPPKRRKQKEARILYGPGPDGPADVAGDGEEVDVAPGAVPNADWRAAYAALAPIREAPAEAPERPDEVQVYVPEAPAPRRRRQRPADVVYVRGQWQYIDRIDDAAPRNEEE